MLCRCKTGNIFIRSLDFEDYEKIEPNIAKKIVWERRQRIQKIPERIKALKFIAEVCRK